MEDLTNPTQPRRLWRKLGLVGLGFALAVGALAGIAWAAGVTPAAVGHGFCRGGGGMGRDFVEFRIHKMLQKVNATAAQEQQINAIVDGVFAKHQGMRAAHEQLHQQLLAALTGPTVDRAGIEAVRTQVVTMVDQGSKDLAQALGDIAEVLTPAQRQQLAALHHGQQ